MEDGGFECEKGCLEHLSSGSESDSSMLILARLDAETKCPVNYNLIKKYN